LKWSGCSDIGKVRKNNEDSFLGLQLTQGSFSSRKFARRRWKKWISLSP